MAPKIKNIIIFLVIATIFILIYVFFIKKTPDTGLVSSSQSSAAQSTVVADKNSSVAQDFLSLLLSVKNIKLNDAIFSDNAFNSLRDSSIVLTPDGNEGRLNPFAPLGTDNIMPPVNTFDTNTPIPIRP